MSFRIWALFNVMAVVATALAIFGIGGVVAAAVVLGFWAWVYHSKPKTTLVELLAVVLIVAILIALLVPDVQEARESSRRGWCMNNLRQLSLALQQYADDNGTLPPAYVADAAGKPLSSWRVLVLPQIERGDLLKRFDTTQAWDGPANATVSSIDIDLFHCPSDASAWTQPVTNYFAVVGPHTAWPGQSGRSLNEITDDRSHTILLIEAAGIDVPWSQPKDISFDEAVELLSDPSLPIGRHLYHRPRGFFDQQSAENTPGLHVAIADGQVRFLPLPLPRDVAIALLTVDGGEQIDTAALDRFIGPQLDYAKCIALAIFVLLALLPVAWLRRRRSDQDPIEHQP